MKKILPKLKHFAQFFLAKFSHNLLLKLLAFLLSLALWTYVVSNDTTITRKITISGLSGYVNGKTTLETNNLALLDDPYTALSDITVQLDVPQAQYSSVTAANVQVSLDVSNIRTAGLQSVPIRASTTTGKVLNVYPSNVDLTFEALDTRSIPINVILENTSDKYWYSVAKTNPQQLTVSGPTSLVSEVVQAIVYADMSDIKTPFTKANSYVLLNSSGEKVNAKMLSLNVSSITVSTDVYPTKTLSIVENPDEILSGSVADGYMIDGITTQPETITVAGEQSLLDSLENIAIEPIEIDEASQDFTKRASISGLSNLKYISVDEIYVTVHISEENISSWLKNVPVTYIGLSDGLEMTSRKDTVSVYVTGPRSTVASLKPSDIAITCNLADLDVGEYDITPKIDDSNYPELTFVPEAETVHVVLDSAEE